MKYIICTDCHGNGYIRQENKNTNTCKQCSGSGHAGVKNVSRETIQS